MGEKRGQPLEREKIGWGLLLCSRRGSSGLMNRNLVLPNPVSLHVSWVPAGGSL